ncbi:MAG TPA: ABC transporter permease [Streptosporangiaceae bacterium]|nr:ABC transporter permease [Streptosporangiaceae bacterium]
MRPRLHTIRVIALREFLARGRSKAFRISTALLLIGLIVGIVVPTVVTRNAGRFAVAVTASGAGMREAITRSAASAGITVTVRTTASRASASALVESGTVSAAVVGDRELIWKSTENARLSAVLNAAIASAEVSQRAADFGLTPGQLALLLTPTRPTVTQLHPGPDRGPQSVIALVGMILLFIAINFYGGYVLTGVVEEKSSRVVEVLLARVRPGDLLVGKVAGIGLLGLTQFAALGAAAAAVLEIIRPPNLPATTLPLIAGVVVWFILGYGFYSMLYGAFGALASRPEDAQAASAPLTVFLTLTYLGAFAAFSTPQAWWVTAASMFPPTAPIFMPLRASVVDVPAWQIAAAMLFTLLAILVVVRIGGRVYRGAVLHVTGRLGIRQAWHLA